MSNVAQITQFASQLSETELQNLIQTAILV